MADFINNLVRKAGGLMLTTGPEQPLIPRSQILSEPLIAVEEKHQGDTGEGSPAISNDGLQNPVKITEDATDPDKNESPEPSSALSIAGFESSAHKGQTTLGSVKEPVDYKARIPELAPSEHDSLSAILRPKAQFEQKSKSTKMALDAIDSSMSSDKNRSPQHSTNSPTVSFESVSQMSPSIPDSGNESVDSKTGMSESDTSELSLYSTLHKPKTQVQQESLKGAARSHDGHVIAGKKPAALRPSFVTSQVRNVSKKTEAGDDTVVTVEPLTETSNQMQIKKLMTSTRNGSSTQPSMHGEANTTQTSQDKKEVRVNIGCIEIKASQKAQRPMNPPERAFDDYLMMRLYLDRHYF